SSSCWEVSPLFSWAEAAASRMGSAPVGRRLPRRRAESAGARASLALRARRNLAARGNVGGLDADGREAIEEDRAELALLLVRRVRSEHVEDGGEPEHARLRARA